MPTLTLKNVRCFGDPGPAAIAPLTILVGENSTGKSSFLALQRIALEVVQGDLKSNFNREPFFLGAYDQIAHFRGGRGGRARAFEITLSTTRSTDTGPQESRLTLTFEKRGSQPDLSKACFRHGRYGMTSTVDSGEALKLEVETPATALTIDRNSFSSYFSIIGRRDLFEPRYLEYVLNEARLGASGAPIPGLPIPGTDEAKRVGAEFGELALLWREFRKAFRHEPYAIAPVRTKPERTYNPIDDTPRSEGTHVPMLLAKLRFTDPSRWNTIKAAIDKFGNESNLFEELTLRTLGRSDSDPFQLLVRIAGPLSNLIDVGYGVSQILPVIVDLLEQKNVRAFLLQQPEVHLHPRGQAALGTFLCNFIRTSKSRVTVETHSDYLIDRIRMEIRRKKFDPNDLSILFFERSDVGVKIHNMRVDPEGNLVGAPRNYRSFFLDEEEQLLGL